MAAPQDRPQVSSATLHFALAGEPWAVETPEHWGASFRTAFAHLPTSTAATPAVRVEARCEATDSEQRWAAALTDSLPDANGIAAIDDVSGRTHVSRLSIDSWDRRDGVRQSILLDPSDEATYLGTNLLLRHIAWRADERGLVPIHAAAVGDRDGFWLVPAAAGQGKSTLAAAALAGGLQVLADDFVLLDPQRRILHSLYGTVRLTPGGHRLVVDHFGADALSIIAERADDKLLLAPGARDDAFAASGPLRGVLLLKRSGRAHMGDTVAPPRALQSFASSLRLLAALAFPAATAFRHFADVARSVECRILETGPDLTALVECLRRNTRCTA